MRRLVLVFIAILALAPRPASALTIRDVLELSRAGLGDEVLLALIEVDRSVFPIDTATLKSLKQAGLSDRVILAMVRSAREPEPMPQPAVQAPVPPEPQVVVIDHQEVAPEVRAVPVAVPVFIPIVPRLHDRVRAIDRDLRGIDPRSDIRSIADKPAKHQDPVYWGWGGKLRPDAWKPN